LDQYLQKPVGPISIQRAVIDGQADVTTRPHGDLIFAGLLDHGNALLELATWG